jgi:hypothetical protein
MADSSLPQPSWFFLEFPLYHHVKVTESDSKAIDEFRIKVEFPVNLTSAVIGLKRHEN